MARRRKNAQRGRRHRPRYLWTGQSLTAPATLTAGAGNVVSIPIVVPSDYVAMTTTEAGGTTVVRIVGSLSYRADAAALTSIYMTITRLGVNEVGLAPNSAAAIINGDVMHFFHELSDLERTFHHAFDVKVSRRLESDAVFMAIEGVGAAHTYSMWARALLIGA